MCSSDLFFDFFLFHFDVADVEEIALVGYNKAVTLYHAAVGDLLDVRNIKVEEEKVEEPHFPFFSAFDRYNWLKYEQPNRSEEKK